MSKLRKLAIVLLVIALAVFLGGFLLPSTWHVERSAVVDAPVGAVFPWVADLTKWPDWTPWSRARDGTAVFEHTGTPGAVGSTMRWKSEKFGDGVVRVVEVRPDELVRYRMDLQSDQLVVEGALQVQALGPDRTRVRWVDDGDLGLNPIWRYFGLAIDSTLGAEMQVALARLEDVVEATPRLPPAPPATGPLSAPVR